MLPNRSIVLLAAAAVILGVASPFIVNVGPDTPRILYAWFYWLPGVVSNWLWPESDTVFMALHGLACHTARLAAATGG